MKASLLFLIVLVGCAVAYPRTYNRRYIQSARLQQQQRAGFIRARRAPIHRAMLIHGFYRPYRPLAQRRQGFEPETSMTAFAAGDSVAAGSYLGSKFGPNCVSCDPQADQENTEFVGGPEADPAQFESEKPIGDYPEAPVGLIPVADAEEADEPVRPLRPISSQKRKPNKIADDDDDADDEQDSFPLKKSKGSNSYFPIVFGGYPGVRSAGGSGGGGVTAIANSYSTGKGGVATSHATAYGGAPPKKGRKGQVPQEDDDE